ncbi:MAG: cysteine desulfurase family protein [Anaerolineales bacterium]|jgi:cysteine desulfurase
MITQEMIYLDHAATTPVDPRVLEAMAAFPANRYGNPSSIHQFGQDAEAAVEEARDSLARILHCNSSEVLFTSGGSESDNLAVRGVALNEKEIRGANHLLISPLEHPAVLRTAEQLRDHFGFQLELLPVDPFGRVDPQVVAGLLRRETALVSVMYASNEIGTLEPIAEIGGICRTLGIPFHSDAVQAASQLPLNVVDLNVDLLSLGAHKFYGPKGVGALYIREGVRLLPTQTGGGQEGGRRAGTHNVPFIVGMAKALEITQVEREDDNRRFQELRDHLLRTVPELVPDVRITGHPTLRLPNHASFIFRGIRGNHLITYLDLAGIACSSGSACKTGDPQPSEVLLAVGVEPEWVLGSLRVTVGRGTVPAHIRRLTEVLPVICERLRSLEAT